MMKIKDFEETELEYLKQSCLNMQDKLCFNGHSDIDGEELYKEIQNIVHYLPVDIEFKNIKEILKYLCTSGMDGIYPNLTILLKITLTIPVTVASAERSFSKLKLIKNYLRSNMSQERLNGLAFLSIEKDISQTLDYSEIINDFASLKARRTNIDV